MDHLRFSSSNPNQVQNPENQEKTPAASSKKPKTSRFNVDQKGRSDITAVFKANQEKAATETKTNQNPNFRINQQNSTSGKIFIPTLKEVLRGASGLQEAVLDLDRNQAEQKIASSLKNLHIPEGATIYLIRPSSIQGFYAVNSYADGVGSHFLFRYDRDSKDWHMQVPNKNNKYIDSGPAYKSINEFFTKEAPNSSSIALSYTRLLKNQDQYKGNLPSQNSPLLAKKKITPVAKKTKIKENDPWRELANRVGFRSRLEIAEGHSGWLNTEEMKVSAHKEPSSKASKRGKE